VWIGIAIGLLVFLPLYFAGYRVSGRARLAVVVALMTLGAVMTPTNFGAVVFFIYAASFVGGGARGHAALGWIAVVTTAGVATVLIGVDPAAAPPWLPFPLVVPVAIFTLLIGFVNIQSAESRRRDVLQRAADEERARLALQEERHRIATDLHDVLGHTLSVIALKADLAGRLSDRDQAAARAEMVDVARIARDALSTARGVVTGIQRISVGDELARARTVLASAGIETTVDEPDVRAGLPESIDHALALVLREAVTNILRHSRATSCHIEVRRTSDQVQLEVTDNGRGGKAPLIEGNGLRGMRARVTELDGTLTMHPDGGLRLVATVPLREHHS
jgi:two-component system sensor histidine kinase DesK